jgi:oxygen-independent coproporphyrinogen-3 oxidase
MGLIDSRQKELAGFDIGGGTPSLIRPERIAELMDQVVRGFRLAHGFGVSIETTPKIAAVLPDRLKDYHRAGIERISMGLQMVNPNLLREYGRDINRVSHNQQAVENIRSAGFKRFNIDLMYGFARQNIEDFQRTLEYTIGLDPEYITLYRMRYKGTKIANEAGDIDLIRVIRMYETAREILSAAGYRANPGKNGFSRVMNDPGTSEYLTQRVVHSVPYLGIGLGAQTFTNNILAYNLGAASKKVEAYLQAVETGNLPIQDLYLLPMSEAMGKMISVAFYFGEIHLGAFKNRFGMDLEHRFPNETAFVLEKGLMEYHGHTLRLTPEGARQFNGVIALFYSDRVKEHLLTL